MKILKEIEAIYSSLRKRVGRQDLGLLDCCSFEYLEENDVETKRFNNCINIQLQGVG